MLGEGLVQRALLHLNIILLIITSPQADRNTALVAAVRILALNCMTILLVWGLA